MQRTPESLRAALFALVLERRDSAFSVGHIIERANVRHALLKSSTPARTRYGLQPAACTCSTRSRYSWTWRWGRTTPRVCTVACDTSGQPEHGQGLAGRLDATEGFRSPRRNGRATARRCVPRMATCVAESARLLAFQRADGLPAAIAAWLAGMSDCSAEQLAQALRRGQVGQVDALRQPFFLAESSGPRGSPLTRDISPFG